MKSTPAIRRRRVPKQVLRCLSLSVCQAISYSRDEFVGDFHNGLLRIFINRFVLSDCFLLAQRINLFLTPRRFADLARTASAVSSDMPLENATAR